MRKDRTADTLLDLDNNVFEVGGGYWVKMKATRVPPDAARPYGVDYSLTLHNASGDRIIGYDNAHNVRTTAGPSGKRRSSRDVASVHAQVTETRTCLAI